jgi:Spy/CpxP family protein refolding chaperone
MNVACRLVLASLVAAPLAAQHPAKPDTGMMHHMMGPGMMGPMMQMQEMMEPMMRAMAFAPDHLLMRKDDLHLSAQQVARLTAIRDAAKTAHEAAQAEAKAHMGALGQAMQANAPDTSSVRVHFQAAHAAMGQAHLTMLTAAAQAKAVLTDEQRGRVNGWADAMERDRMHMGQPRQDERH